MHASLGHLLLDLLQRLSLGFHDSEVDGQERDDAHRAEEVVRPRLAEGVDDGG